MRMRPIPGAAVAFAAALAETVSSPGPAEAFFFLPIFQQQSQPSIESRSGRSPSDNNRWRRGDRPRDEAAEPVKPSGGTRAKRDEEKSSTSSSGKSGKSQAKSETSSSQASRTRSVRQEPPPSKSSGAPTPRCAGKAPRAEAVRRPPRRRPSPATPARTPPRRRPVLPAPAAPSAIPSTRSSARCSRRGLTRSSSRRISRAQPKHPLSASATHVRLNAGARRRTKLRSIVRQRRPSASPCRRRRSAAPARGRINA
jgi:hypothetical protein